MVAKNNWTSGEKYFHTDANALANEVNAKLTRPAGGDTTTFLRGDDTWAVPAGTGGGGGGTLTDNSVTNAKMADDAVGIAELSAAGTPNATTFLRGDNTWAAPSVGVVADDSITSAKMADGAIGLDELSATGTPTALKFLRGDNTWAVPAGTGGSSDLTDVAHHLVFTTVWPTRPADGRPVVFVGGEYPDDQPTGLVAGDMWHPSNEAAPGGVSSADSAIRAYALSLILG